ncbi:OmpH family outer membrane protein [Candidatus Dependentiae bacterium]|nr:OmpH family outer membrane protein [Candidatus Dependentiae bacterium]
MNNASLNKIILSLTVFLSHANFTENITTSIDDNGIVTISGQKVMTESLTGKAMQEKLQREQKKVSQPLEQAQQEVIKSEKTLRELQEELQREFTKFENDSKTMSNDAREKKQIELQDKALDFEGKKRVFERDTTKLQADARKIEMKMNELYQNEMTKIDTLVKATIEEEAKKRGWKIVLMKESVMFAASKTDQTDVIIKALDEKTKALNMAKKEAIEKKSDPKNAKK